MIFRRIIPMVPLLFAALLSAASPTSPKAQAPPPPPEPEAGPDAGGRREAARFFLLQRMREEVQLTDAQSLKVLDIMREMDGERAAHRRTMEAITARMRDLLRSEGTTDAQFREQVAAHQREAARFESRQRELEQRVLELLSPRQQAGFLLLKRRLLSGGGPPPGAAPGQGHGRGRGRS